MTSERYNAREAEPRWQKTWAERGTFATRNEDPRPKHYVLEMFPYPSGRIHMGHVRNYAMGDALARYKRATGFNVLHPMGWDAFGLPAENAAIERKVHPKEWTYANIATMKAQLKSMGLSLDWNREIATCDPAYYKHQQKLFIDFLQAGLVERKQSKVNWDPVDQTVLANEQVIDGRGWRSDAVVEQRELSQWFFKITAYSQELLEALDRLDRWPEKVRLMQRNWIGRSEGLLIRFALDPATAPNRERELEIFTTRHDTLFGSSFMAISPDHPLAGAPAPKKTPAPPLTSPSPPPPARGRSGRKKPGARRLHCRMPPPRHLAGRARDRGEARLRHRDEGNPSVRSELEAAGVRREFHSDGIRHRRDLRLPGARPTRPRLRQQIRTAGDSGRVSAWPRRENLHDHRRGL